MLLLLIAALGAHAEGEDLVFTGGEPGVEVAVLGPDEKRLAHGHVGPDGALRLAGQGSADPMLRLVEVGGRRAALSDLFPPVELLAVLPPKLSAGLEVDPHVRVTPRKGRSAELAGIDLSVALICGKARHALGAMRSDANGIGVPAAPMLIPAAASGACMVELRGAGAKIEQPVTVTRGARLVVSSDRPVYHPGNPVHLRGLALDAATAKPLAKEAATFELRDPRGAVLARASATSSAFGVSNADLAVPAGYASEAVIARFALGGESVEKRLVVGEYVPPRVTVSVAPESPSARPGQELRARIAVARADGGPVAGSSVELTASLPNGSTVFRKRATCDAGGLAVASGLVPKDVAAPRLILAARAEVITGDSATGKAEVGVDDGALTVFAVPESGVVVPGVTNGFWLVTVDPSGAPIAAAVELVAGDQRTSVKTDADGLAYARLDVRAAERVEARAVAGTRTGRRTVTVDRSAPRMLLRIDPPVADAGAPIAVEVLAPGRQGLAIVDLAQAEHPVASIAVPLSGGRGTGELRLPPSTSGTVRVNAWHANGSSVASDTRLLLVEDGRDLRVKLAADRSVYAPRQPAEVAVSVTDARGRPQVAALGLVAVDEGLLALGLEQPGIERALARLGRLWDHPAADVPEWTRTALFAARDRRRLAVMAAAVEAHLPMMAPEETGPRRASEASVAFGPALAKRAEVAARALTAWYKGRASRRGKPATGADLVAAKLLGAHALDDPWGRAVELSLDVDAGCCRYTVQVRSRGANGERGDADDVEGSAEFEGYARRNCGCGWGFGRGGIGAGGGGTAFGYAGVGTGLSLPRPPLREDFPETLAFERALITGEDGTATWRLTMADSLTRWLVQARAVSLEGGLGDAELVLRVEQPFSIDASLPPALTRLDELEVPVGLTNRTSEPREVEVEVAASGALEGSFRGRVTVAPGASAAVPVTVRAARVGEGAIEVTARGEGVADAARRTLKVEADGVPVELVRSGAVAAGSRAAATLDVPEGGVPGTRKLTLRIYPSAVGAAVEGLESLLAQPAGCFEQTSATTYPNALVLDYLRRTKQASPEVTTRAQSLLAAGWKRLTSFEVKGGGFSWFGDAPANKILTAFGIMELERIAAVHEVDRDVAKRTRAWLLAQRKADGSYAPDASYLHADSWSRIQNASLPVTAYIVWALAQVGPAADVAPSVAWVRAHAGEADDPYVQALVALALSAADAAAGPAVSARAVLASMATVEAESASWRTGMKTATYAAGPTAGIETSGLSAIAMLAGGDQAELSRKAVSGLMAQRRAGAGWGSTQATTLALQALLDAEARAASPASGVLSVSVDGGAATRMTIAREDFDVVRTIELPAGAGRHTVELSMAGAGQLQWQLAATRNVPSAEAPAPAGALSLAVTPDRTRVRVGETVHTAVRLTANGADVRMPTITVGLPAGFELDETSLARAKVAKHEVLGRRLVLYLEHLPAGATFEASFDLVARRAGSVSAGLASAWPYYQPELIARVEQARFAAVR